MPSSNIPRATAALRQVRARMLRDLAELAEQVGVIRSLPGDAQTGTMERIVAALDACLRPHLRWEEITIHPIVDKYACEGPAAFSTSMRYEHEIIYRWIADLRELAGGDPVTFARRADSLLGVVIAHFELEEHVLFPILDRSMSPEAFRAQAGGPQTG